ncbi:MAG: DUF4493 domain-containing protein [Bacteroidaceae bacterium]|nr:DUF4493 domain-containing protein [Bacteroidaceae bacterium]
MKRIHTILLCAAALLLSACQQDNADQPSPDGLATIRLSLGGAQLFTELQTRAEEPVADLSKYVFTISGTTISGAAVTDLTLDVAADGTAQLNAGTYTLTADNAAAANEDNGRPYYHGTSDEFTISVNETKNVSIALGKPKNARIMLAYDTSYTTLYENPVVTLADNERSVTLTSTEEVCYFIIPASGALAYTITANALAGSHATDMPQSQGYVDIQAGYNTTIILKANPATGVIIPVTEGEYSGTFD